VTYTYVVSDEAKADIREILIWSHARFGDSVRDGYEELIFTAITDIAADPARVGVRDRPELGDAVRSMHLAQSRDNVGAGVRRIMSPRHFVIFRTDNVETVFILRILHDSMNLSDHHIP
jgi:toxin ParE1/3/4